MIEALKQWAIDHGDRLQVIPVSRLKDIKSELEIFAENGDLNSFQKWIVNDLYRFDLPAVGFAIQSIILVAVPHPFYANVEFDRHGKKYNFLSLVTSDFDRAQKDLSDFLSTQNCHILPAANLPLKRLAVKSGLAVYGKNNICYVEGMGSLFSFTAYFSDVPWSDDHWTDILQFDRCSNCWACANNCPTGAIRMDRFLIDNERCLSNLNESRGEFPVWLPKSAHHCLYDCLKCQITCPMNKEFLNNTASDQSNLVKMKQTVCCQERFTTFSPELKQKSKLLGLDQWLDNIPRNLNVLFELSDHPL